MAGKKLKQRYGPHRLEGVVEKMKKRHEFLLRGIDETEMKPSDRLKLESSVEIIRGYDLRYSMATKALDTSMYAGWTAFVNNAHTLVHLIPRDGDFLVRIPLYYSLKGATDQYLRTVIGEKVKGMLYV